MWFAEDRGSPAQTTRYFGGFGFLGFGGRFGVLSPMSHLLLDTLRMLGGPRCRLPVALLRIGLVDLGDRRLRVRIGRVGPGRQ
jgi:hypothetical protein